MGYSLDVVLVQQAEVLLEQSQVALQGIFVEGKVQPGAAWKQSSREIYLETPEK